MSFLGMLIPNSTWIFSQTFSDNFNRSDRSINGDNGWISGVDVAVEPNIFSNQLRISQDVDGGIVFRGPYQGGSLPGSAAEYAECNILGEEDVGPMVRGLHDVTPGQGNWEGGFWGAYVSGAYRLYRLGSNNSKTELANAGGPGLGSHVVRVAAIGKEIRLYVNNTLLVVVVDSGYPSVGKQGVMAAVRGTTDTRLSDDYAHGDTER